MGTSSACKTLRWALSCVWADFPWTQDFVAACVKTRNTASRWLFWTVWGEVLKYLLILHSLAPLFSTADLLDLPVQWFTDVKCLLCRSFCTRSCEAWRTVTEGKFFTETWSPKIYLSMTEGNSNWLTLVKTKCFSVFGSEMFSIEALRADSTSLY